MTLPIQVNIISTALSEGRGKSLPPSFTQTKPEYKKFSPQLSVNNNRGGIKIERFNYKEMS